MTELHPLTQVMEKQGIHFGATAWAASIDWNKVNHLILQEMKRIYERLTIDAYWVINGEGCMEGKSKNKLKQILGLPEKKSLEEELADRIRQKCMQGRPLSLVDENDIEQQALKWFKENKGKFND